MNRKGMLVDSTGTRPSQAIPKTWTFFNNATLYRHNREGSEIILGDYNNPQPESEGLIGAYLQKSYWYYADEKGNRFYEED